MLSFFAFIIGIALTTIVGWLAVSATQRMPVLSSAERWAWGAILGPTLAMLFVFVVNVVGLTSLTLLGFLGPILLLIVLLGGINWKFGTLQNALPASVVTMSSTSHPRWLKIGILVLCVWTAIKIIGGAYDAVSVPTYWDDSFNNWNMRGKIFYETKKLELEIPIGNGMVATSEGVSSYPPSVSLMKTWMAVLRGMWSEPMVNGVHLVWFLGLIAAFYLTLRRRTDAMLSAFGTYLAVSLPLFIVQGVNPYADVFVASHLFVLACAIFGLGRAEKQEEFGSWLMLTALALGLLIFTKNEGSVLYGPIAAVTILWVLWNRRKANVISADALRRLSAKALGLVALIVLPWLGFKWLNGLTFGNAKSVSGVSFAYNPVVADAIWFHLTHEPNWLFLPLALPLSIVVAGKRALRPPFVWMTFFVLATIAAQFALFLFVPAVANEAIMQTGLSRGLLHIAPVAMLLTILLTLDYFVRSDEVVQ